MSNKSALGNENVKIDKFYAGGFLYNPATRSVLLHKRDSKTKVNPNQWAFFGGLMVLGYVLTEKTAKDLKIFIKKV